MCPAAYRPDWIIAAAGFPQVLSRPNTGPSSDPPQSHAVPCCHGEAHRPPTPHAPKRKRKKKAEETGSTACSLPRTGLVVPCVGLGSWGTWPRRERTSGLFPPSSLRQSTCVCRCDGPPRMSAASISGTQRFDMASPAEGVTTGLISSKTPTSQRRPRNRDPLLRRRLNAPSPLNARVRPRSSLL